jgi:hypothetical protein
VGNDNKRFRYLLLSAILAVVLLAAACGHAAKSASGEKAPAASEKPASGESDTGGEADEFAQEKQERAEATRARMEAMQNFPERTGTADSAPVKHIPGATWAGAQKFGNQNDWEPDIAADPSSNYVYWVTTRYGDRACNKCPNAGLVYRVSPDNGNTWGPVKYECKCKGAAWQADPQVEVADNGTVYITILQQWHTYVRTSTDHGQTWGPLVNIAPSFNWTDHGFLTVSPDGQDVYVAFSHGGSWVATSHDGGATFADPVQTNVKGQNEYYYQYKGASTGDSAWIAATSVPGSPYAAGPIKYWVLRTVDGGATWDQVLITTVEEQPTCKTPWNPDCHPDHFAGLSGLDRSSDGTLVYTYAGSTVPRNGEQVYTTFSTDNGATWSQGQAQSPEKRVRRRVIAVFPQVISGGPTNFRLWYMDDRRGLRRWNIWYRESNDGGVTWTDETRISDASSGAGYQHVNGFDADYGDYGGIDVMSDGRTVATWGAGYSYFGPGGTWLNRQS